MRTYILMIVAMGMCFFTQLNAQDIPYGNNPDAGDYFDAGDIKLYYEVYGEGKPILLLHGGVFGYIDEFTALIPKLAETHQVICLATRGHGKSEIGKEPYTYQQRAEDAHKLLQHLKADSVTVLGFSDGGFAALSLAALYPKNIIKVVAMGIGAEHEGKVASNYDADTLLKQYPFFQGRLALMPEPKRWNESLKMLNELYNNNTLDETLLKDIKCPVLLMNGERDGEYPIETILAYHKEIPMSFLSIIPACSHVIFFCNFSAMWESMHWFLR